jgi:hypothetical protein
LAGIVRGVKAPDALPIAIQALGFDEIADEIQRVEALAADGEGRFRVRAPRKLGEARLDAGRNLAAIAAGTAEPGRFRIEDEGRTTALGRRPAGHQPGIARTDDQHVDFAR